MAIMEDRLCGVPTYPPLNVYTLYYPLFEHGQNLYLAPN